MLPAVDAYFENTAVGEFFRRIIPVSMDVWILFFLAPFVLALTTELLLCARSRRLWPKFLPPLFAVLLAAAVMICYAADVLQNIIGGFVTLILLASAAFIVFGSLLGWILWAGGSMLSLKLHGSRHGNRA